MPFQSEKQRRYMHANLPDIANRWEAKYGLGGFAELNTQLNDLPEYYIPKNQGGFIPSHEAGIYGLAEGGTPMLVAKRNDGQRPGYGWDPGAGAPQATASSSGSVGGEGYQNVHQTGAVTQTPGRTTTDQGHTGEGWQTNAIPDTKKKKATIDDSGEVGQGFIGKITKKYPKFFQIDTAKKIKQIKNMSWKEAWNLEKQMSKSLFGKGYTGVDKVGGSKYITEGIKSLFMDPSKWSSKIGGATSLAKKLAVLAGEKVLPAVMGGTNIIGAPLAYVQGASVLQNFLESQGMKKGALGDDILARGAEAAGADVLSIPDEDNATSQDLPPNYSGTAEFSAEEKGDKYVPLQDTKFNWEGQEGGIAGLKQGGRIGFFTGMREAEQEAQSTGGEYQNVHQTGAVSQTPGRTATPDLPPQLGGSSTGEDAITYARDNFETQKATLESKINKSIGWKILGGILGGGLTLGLGDLRTAKNMYDLTQVKKDYINLLENAKTLYQKQGGPEFNPHVDTAIQTINQEILDLTQTSDRPQQDTGGDGVTGVASITYDDIEDTNRKEQASAEWRQEQEKVDRSKQDAYYAAFRQKYLMGDTEEPQTMFVAQGGRIPGGYNTGGLSNLFRLKNR